MKLQQKVEKQHSKRNHFTSKGNKKYQRLFGKIYLKKDSLKSFNSYCFIKTQTIIPKGQTIK